MTKHELSAIRSPISVTMVCRCGWRFTVDRSQEAFARAAKLRAAIRKHMEIKEKETTWSSP